MVPALIVILGRNPREAVREKIFSYLSFHGPHSSQRFVALETPNTAGKGEK